MDLIIGITGASGAIYGVRLLETLSGDKTITTHLIISDAAVKIIKYETELTIDKIKGLASYTYDIDDIGTKLASGTFKTEGMIIAPCTVKTMSALANSYTDNLLTRAADVTLKERRKLVVLFRETPLHLGHIRNMEKLTEMGGIIMVPVPAFYNKPKSLEDIIDHTVGRLLDIFSINHSLYIPWKGKI